MDRFVECATLWLRFLNFLRQVVRIIEPAEVELIVISEKAFVELWFRSDRDHFADGLGTIVACVTGLADEELLRRNEYLVTENRQVNSKQNVASDQAS